MEYVELDEEMDMPCPCPNCGNWHELNDSKTSQRNKKLICPECYEEEFHHMVKIEALKKGDQFEQLQEEYTVTKKYRSIDSPMKAKPEFGAEIEFYYGYDEVYKINKKKGLKT